MLLKSTNLVFVVALLSIDKKVCVEGGAYLERVALLDLTHTIHDLA